MPASLWRGAERAGGGCPWPRSRRNERSSTARGGRAGSGIVISIDKQNVGPIYALALGDFDEGTGGVAVEADARTVCGGDGTTAKVDGGAR